MEGIFEKIFGSAFAYVIDCKAGRGLTIKKYVPFVSGHTVMKYFSSIWRVLINLATAAVILAMFHIAHSPFETIVISALVLIYVSVISSYKALGYAQSKKWQIDLARYIKIATSLKLNTELEEEAQKENSEEDQKGQLDFWIAAGFDVLFGVIATVHLVYAVTAQS